MNMLGNDFTTTLLRRNKTADKDHRQAAAKASHYLSAAYLRCGRSPIDARATYLPRAICGFARRRSEASAIAQEIKNEEPRK